LSVSSLSSAPTFPMVLHKMLDDCETIGFHDVVGWMPGGQVFKIHDPERFAAEVLPRYFHQTKYKIFQRQCNIYGFQRVHRGPHRGGYTHKFFIRGAPELCELVKREAVSQADEVRKVRFCVQNILMNIFTIFIHHRCLPLFTLKLMFPGSNERSWKRRIIGLKWERNY
jgi:hypothetical protein